MGEKGGESLGIRFIKIAGVYFFLAVILGLVMGIIQNFAFTSVHAHLNLLGWVSMALFGLIYSVYKRAGETTLAKAHFWLHNIGLPIMQGTLFLELLTGNTSLNNWYYYWFSHRCFRCTIICTEFILESS